MKAISLGLPRRRSSLPFLFSLRPENGPSPCFAQIDDLKKVAGIEIVDDGKTSGMSKVRLSKRMFIEGDGMVPVVHGQYFE
jgi:hypothetical protein